MAATPSYQPLELTHLQLKLCGRQFTPAEYVWLLVNIVYGKKTIKGPENPGNLGQAPLTNKANAVS